MRNWDETKFVEELAKLIEKHHEEVKCDKTDDAKNKQYVGVFATGGMRGNADGIIEAWNDRKVQTMAEGIHAKYTNIIGSKGAAIEGSLEGLFAIKTALHQHKHETFEDRSGTAININPRGGSLKVGAMDWGGQTNQLAWEKVGDGPCNFPMEAEKLNGASRDE